MADPLSIAASIAGLVTLAEVVFTRTYKYVRAVKKAAAEISALSSEIGALYGLLCSLRTISLQLEGEKFESTARIHYINSCQQTLEKVKDVLDKDKSSSSEEPWDALKYKLRWPFKSNEVKALLEDIERHKATLSVALGADSISGLFRILSGQKELNTTLEGIQNELRIKREMDVRIELDEKRHRILQTFSRIDHRINHDMNRKLRHPGTGIWLMESPRFVEWLRSDEACLWLFGIPGAGKTILASMAIDEALMQCKSDHALAYFYCDYKDPSTQEPQNILGSLVQQIARQDEQAFEKLEKFYDHKNDVRSYDSALLRDLLRDMGSVFTSTSIIVDALDECSGHVRDIIELLTSLRQNAGGSAFKLLLFSRDEIEIRDLLEDSPQISVAAEITDLKLFVGAEIEERISKKRLNIKSPSLKEHMLERLINGAEGMFRWVTCQMDYLCELPHDAARRKALHNLPRGLTPTYERILRKINGSSAEAQKLAQRTFRWLFYRGWKLNSRSLCEAVAIEIRDSSLDPECLPDESDILRLCGSLIRRSKTGDSLEFAHFTVKEFLSQLAKDDEFAMFAMDENLVKQDLTKTYLTLISMPQFDTSIQTTGKILVMQREKHPLLALADRDWPQLVPDWCEKELIMLLREFFDPSKKRTLVSWVLRNLCDDYTLRIRDFQIPEGIKEGVKEATPLHFAAMFGISQICKWLIESGSDVNRRSKFGNPIQSAIITMRGFFGACIWDGLSSSIRLKESQAKRQLETVEVLLTAGGDVGAEFTIGQERLSTLTLALVWSKSIELPIRLYHKGARFNSQDLSFFCDRCYEEDDIDRHKESILSIAQSMSKESSSGPIQELILRRNLIANEKDIDLSFLVSDEIRPKEMTSAVKLELQASIRTAAAYGQLALMTNILDKYEISIDAADETTGQTALHSAAGNDHLAVVGALAARGANLFATDRVGETALHHSVDSSDHTCLQFLLNNNLDANVADLEGFTVWHSAISRLNVQVLEMLTSHCEYNYVTHRMRPLLPYAAQRSASLEIIVLLLIHGCDVQDTDAEGYSALHYAAQHCSLSCIRCLLDHGADVLAIAKDGSSPLHLAASSQKPERHSAISYLVDKGSHPFLARHDTLTPVDIWIESFPADDDPASGRGTLQVLLSGRSDIERLLRFCRLDLLQNPLWLAVALQTLLDNGGDLTSRDDSGKTALRILFESWRHNFSKVTTQSSMEAYRSEITKPTQVLCLALVTVPAETFLESVESISDLLEDAIILDDEVFARRILTFSPKVDYVSSKGIISGPLACAVSWTCELTLFKDLLHRSSVLSDQTVAHGVYRAVVRADDMECAQELFDFGVKPHSHAIEGDTLLSDAVYYASVDMFKWLVDRGVDVRSLNGLGQSAAHHACARGSIEILRILSAMDTDWNGRATTGLANVTFYGLTVLHLAAAKGNLEVLEYLVDKRLSDDLNCRGQGGETPLWLAVWCDEVEVVDWLLSQGVMTNTMSHGESPLHVCMRRGIWKMYQLFESHQCDFLTRNEAGLDCEMIALRYDHGKIAKRVRLVKDLQSSRPNISLDSQQQQSMQALKLGIEIGDMELCVRAYAQGADLDGVLPGTNGKTPVSYCQWHDEPRIAKFLVLQGVKSISTVDRSSLFHCAISWDHLDLLKLLLEKHPSSLFKNQARTHPVHIAVRENAQECLTLMLTFPYPDAYAWKSGISSECGLPAEYLANVLEQGEGEPEEESGLTPLHLAAISNNHVIARQLLAAGGRVNVTTSRHNTALHVAGERADAAFVDLLLRGGANIHARNGDLDTPFMMAAMYGNFDSLQRLTSTGVDLEARNWTGKSILHLAARSGSIECLAYLINKAPTNVYLGKRCAQGGSVWGAAFESAENGQSFLINLAPNPSIYQALDENVLSAAVASFYFTVQQIKMLVKRTPKELLKPILSHDSELYPSPLYRACTETTQPKQAGVIGILLQAGASPNDYGGFHGSPLMAACKVGRLSAVKLLVKGGANTYGSIGKDGKKGGLLSAAKDFPDIIDWLLVGRFRNRPLPLPFAQKSNSKF